MVTVKLRDYFAPVIACAAGVFVVPASNPVAETTMGEKQADATEREPSLQRETREEYYQVSHQLSVLQGSFMPKSHQLLQ